MKHLTVLRGSLESRHLARRSTPARDQNRAGRDGVPQCPLQLDVHTLEFDGDFCLFDVQSCTLMVADRLTQDILRLSATNTERQVQAILGNTYKTVEVTECLQELDLLINNGFLHRRAGTHTHHSPTPDEIHRLPVSLLSLGLTSVCNMSCSYCFEKSGPRPALKRMDPKLAILAFDWFLKRSGAVEQLYIRFFGGEPLLNFPAMESVASSATAKAHERDKDVTFLINTNGTLFDETILDFVTKYRVGVCISLDGQDRYHDIHRRFTNGHGSFDKVVLAVRKLMKRGGSGGIQAQAVLTRQTRDGLRDMPRFFRDMGFDGVYVGFVDSGQNDSYSLSEADLTVLYGDYINLVEACMVEAQPCRFDLSGHDKILRRLYRGELAYYACPTYAGISMFHIDPIGDMYPCYRLLTHELRLGNVVKGIPTAQADRIRKGFVADNVCENECRQCWARHLCGGMCPARSRHRNGLAGHCDLGERMVLNLGLYIRLWRRHRPLLDALYGAAASH